jgi:hypothetical protein
MWVVTNNPYTDTSSRDWCIMSLDTNEVKGYYHTEEDARQAYVNIFGCLPPTEEEVAKFG